MADGSAANLHLLRRVKVLLVSRDRRFLRVARFLLAREDLVVDSTSKPDELLARVSDGVNVVVIDGTRSLSAAARDVAEIQALHPEIGVIVVAEDPEPPTSAFRLLSKWASLEHLGEEVKRAYLRP
jgi:DNA-binding NtrC family response regulator